MTSEPSLLQMPDVALNEIVKKWRNSEHLLNTNYIDCFSTDFAIAMSSEKSIIQQFFFVNAWELHAKDVMRNVKSQNSLLKVRNAELFTSEPSRIVDFLQLLDPNYLETIKISGDCFMNELTKITEICQLEQFKNAKELKISSYFITTPLEYFSHFEKVTVSYECVTEEMLTSLKQMFITSPNLSSFSIQFLSYCDRDLICCFGPRDKQLSTHDTDKWVLMIPGSDDVIVVEMKLSRVQFERKKNN